MTSSRPYLIRALYEWIVDNGKTPMLVVREDAAAGGGTAARLVEEGDAALRLLGRQHDADAVALRALRLGKQLHRDLSARRASTRA